MDAFTHCEGCGAICASAKPEDGKQLCGTCLKLLLPFEGDCTDFMIERVRAKLAECSLGLRSAVPTDIVVFESVVVPAGAHNIVVIQKDFAFRPCALRLTADVAKAFDIEEIRIGRYKQLHGCFAGMFFDDDYQDRFGRIPMKLDVVAPHVDFAMHIVNRTASTSAFTALWEIQRLT